MKVSTLHSSVLGLCKVMVFAERCPAEVESIENEEFNTVEQNYNVLYGFTMIIRPPEVTTSPELSNCNNPVWTVYRKSDNTDITVLYPHFFTIEGKKKALYLKNVLSRTDYDERKFW